MPPPITSASLAAPSACAVCAQPVKRAPLPGDTSSCGAPFCRQVLAQAAGMAGAHRQFFLESQREVLRTIQRNAQVEKREERQRQEIMQRALLTHPALPLENVLLTEIPSGRSAAGPLPSTRVEKYRNHLKTVIGEALALRDQSPEEAPPQGPTSSERDSAALARCAAVEARFRQQPALRATSERLCTLCKGACCSGGKNNAYIKVDTILRLLHARPELSGDDILALYLSHLHRETVVDSCVNQTDAGCSLPRELRSTTCNGFFCDALVIYQQAVDVGSDPGQVLAVQRAGNYWQRKARDADRTIVNIALVDSEAVYPVDIDLTGIEQVGADEGSQDQ